MSILTDLPERGWGVLRPAQPAAVPMYHAAGLIKARAVAPGVYEARLTGAGRRQRAADQQQEEAQP